MKITNKKKLALKKFHRHFRNGFYDQKYLDWERDYKWSAHLEWEELLNEKEFKRLLKAEEFSEIAKRAARIESRTNLLFSFEKMALRDAVKISGGAELFSKSLYDFIYGKDSLEKRFSDFSFAVSKLPRKQTRVLTWPLLTVFGFIAKPEEFIFLKPRVTQEAAKVYGYDFQYISKPQWKTYQSLLGFAHTIKEDFPALKARDYIDLQSFIWVLGSEEYD